MTITAKFESTCPSCRQPIAVGAQVNWERGQKASHVECPKGAVLAAKVLAQPADAQVPNITALCDALSGEAVQGEGRTVLAEALDIIEAALSAEYARQTPAAVPPTQAGSQRLEALAKLQKGIYRVSLTGQERRYGIDHVNLQLTPSPKFGTVKVAEYQRDGLGRVDRDGEFRFWPSFEDRTSVRTLALLAGLEVLLGSADPIEFAKAYAVESSTCWRCGLPLVDPKSRERLMGDSCYRQSIKGA